MDVDIDVAVRAHGASDDVALGEVRNLFGQEAMPVDELVGQRVISRELKQRPSTETVDPTVADMGDDEPVAGRENRRDGRTGPALARTESEDAAVRGVDGPDLHIPGGTHGG